ncbi:MAG: helix-turn-helix domain-containing protein [Phycisphaerae bacterium]
MAKTAADRKTGQAIECEQRRLRGDGSWRLHAAVYLHLPVSAPLALSTPSHRQTAQAGELFLCPPGMLYRFEIQPAQAVEAITVRIRSRAFNPGVYGDRQITRMLWALRREGHVHGPLLGVPTAARSRIGQLAELLRSRVASSAATAEAACKAATIELLLAAVASRPAGRCSTAPESPTDAKILDVLWYLDEHFAEKLTAAQLADSVGLSRSHFHAAFRKYTGQTVGEHLRSLRIARATRLLADSDAAITDVAARCGYDSLSQFYQTFGAVIGCPPGEYRRSGQVPSERG